MGRASWEAEYSEYFALRAVPLRRLAYALCSDWHLSEDLVQGTFLKLYQHWPRIRADTVDAYARRVLVNSYLSRGRGLRGERIVAEVPDRPAAEVPVTDAVDLARAMATLTPKQRTLIALRFVEDVSVAETASLLGISEGTVKSQTFRATRTLRAYLGASTHSRE
ncbi:SigE family RNA polymerase sigma factor [Dactylosporangium sp. NPDC049742]|uniref:SigE family RNA polymerase sigma factor n=1 Tax=Dactylosporangium sp. NPDC049742 TaxID=3154737 RepID=UPI003446C8DD